MAIDTSLLNTQHYKVRIKGKGEQSRERSNAPLHLGVAAIEAVLDMDVWNQLLVWK